MKSGINRKALITVAAGLLISLAAIAAEPKPSSKWRLEFSGGANSDGTIVVQLTPEGGAALDVSIEVKKGAGENDVARAVVKGLKAKLPGSAYKVERDDGEDVLIKKRSNTPKFVVVISSNSAEGVKIHPEHE